MNKFLVVIDINVDIEFSQIWLYFLFVLFFFEKVEPKQFSDM